MKFKLPELPYPTGALEPFLSQETLDFHHGKHHLAYIEKLNELVGAQTELYEKSIEILIRDFHGPIFNNAAQAWNHTFYWDCLSPDPENRPLSQFKDLSEAITRDFGSVKNFTEAFTGRAAEHFGSGWVWLVKDDKDKLSILATHDAELPQHSDLIPLLNCDVWEHAYYIDYRNERKKYLDGFWHFVNWEFAEARYHDPKTINLDARFR